MTRVQTLSDIRALHSPSWGDGSVPGFTVPEQRKAFPTLVAQAQPEGCWGGRARGQPHLSSEFRRVHPACTSWWVLVSILLSLRQAWSCWLKRLEQRPQS